MYPQKKVSTVMKFVEHKQELWKLWLSFIWFHYESHCCFYTRQNHKQPLSKHGTTFVCHM